MSQPYVESESHNRSVAHTIRNPQATTSLAEPIGPQTGNVRTTMIQVNDALHHKIDPSLISALQQGPRDRTFLLRIEKQLTAYIQQPVEQIRLPTPFPPYQRMLVHRLADYFGLARIVEKKGQEATMTLIKTAESRIPKRSLQMVCEELLVLTPEERRQTDFKPMIQQRAYPSDSEPFDRSSNAGRGNPLSNGGAAKSTPLSPPDTEQFVEPRTDVTGIDYSLMAGLCNPRERKFLLKLEKEVIRQIQVPTCRNIKLTTPFMSYHRMLVHRLADYYGLARIIEKKGQSSLTLITLVKCESTRIPDRTLSMAAEELDTTENVPKEDEECDQEEKVVFTQTPKIMRRERTPEHGKLTPQQCKESLSLEDRERQYAEVRRRIFGSEQEFEDTAEPAQQKGGGGKGKVGTPPKGGNSKGNSNAKWPQNERPEPKVKAQVDKWQDFYDPAYDRSHPQYPGKGNPLMGATPVCHTALGQLAAQQLNTPQRVAQYACDPRLQMYAPLQPTTFVQAPSCFQRPDDAHSSPNVQPVYPSEPIYGQNMDLYMHSPMLPGARVVSQYPQAMVSPQYPATRVTADNQVNYAHQDSNAVGQVPDVQLLAQDGAAGQMMGFQNFY